MEVFISNYSEPTNAKISKTSIVFGSELTEKSSTEINLVKKSGKAVIVRVDREKIRGVFGGTEINPAHFYVFRKLKRKPNSFVRKQFNFNFLLEEVVRIEFDSSEESKALSEAMTYFK